MRAAVLTQPGEQGVMAQAGDKPVVQDFRDPEPVDGAVMIDVTMAGLGGWDIVGAYQFATEFPCVIRGEGTGHAEDGRRVYFGEHSVSPFGAWAERTVVPAAEVWDIPDGVDDKLAIAMAIAGTGAVVPLDQAAIKPGERVLVLGATGTLGQIALQLARHMGAGRVVGAGRNEKALARITEMGIADGTAQIGAGVDADAAALKAEAGDGFDVVLDVVYGEPFQSALKATRFGARIMSIGVQAGLTAVVPLPDLLYRTHTCVGTGQAPAAERQQTWRRLLDIAQTDNFVLDYQEFTLDQAADAWAAQKSSPHAKVVGTI